MKRYRVVSYDFDSRPWLLSTEIQDSWEPAVKENWRENRKRISEDLVEEYGSFVSEAKLRNFAEFGQIPFSVLAFHNRFVSQIQRAFVIGGYYPALTAACALGERILNHLVLELRDDFRSSSEYKRVYRKDSFDDWEIAIATLEAWNVLLPVASDAFRELHRIRNRAIHFRPEVDHTDRPLALEAIRALLKIVESQFGSGGPLPWFIPNVPGEVYIAKNAESLPFVRRVYLPNCRLVGPHHRLSRQNGDRLITDTDEYEARDVTDEEFAQLRKAARS